MQPERYTQYLPPDLTGELALRLPWREFYESYIDLPEFRRYDDPNHRLWRDLYKRDLSTYPLPDGVPYREQYFWGNMLLDGLDLSQNEVHDSIMRLIKLGYDIPLTKLIPSTPPTDNYFTRAFQFSDAIRGGYVPIVNLLMDTYPAPDFRTYMHAAIHSRSLEMLNYVLARLPDEPTDPLVVESDMRTAAEEGYVDIFDRLLEYYSVDDSVYCNYLSSALESDTAELAARMLDRCADSDIKGFLGEVKYGAILGLLQERGVIKDVSEVPPDVIMMVGANDCILEYMQYAHSRGAVMKDVHHYPLSDCTDPNIHQWIIETMPQSEYEHLMAYLVYDHPDLAALYMNSLSAPISLESKYELVSNIIQRNRLNLMEMMVENPHIRLGERIAILDDHTFGVLLKSPVMLKFYLDLPRREVELDMLKHINLNNLAGVISQREYTNKELITLLSDRLEYPNRPEEATKRLAQAVPPHQRKAVIKGLTSYYFNMLKFDPHQEVTPKGHYLAHLIYDLRYT